MKSRTRAQAVFFLLPFIGVAFGFASQRLITPRSSTTPILVQTNSTPLLPTTGFLKSHSPPPDPWTYLGPKRRYKLSHYRNPSIKLSWLATFLLTCIGDVFDATASQGFRQDQPYPNGVYNCYLDHRFPSGSSGLFVLEMTKVEAPNWYMTFSDVVDDLEALWYAALWFDEGAAGVPEMEFDVYETERQTSGDRGVSFLASHGYFAFALTGMVNVSDA